MIFLHVPIHAPRRNPLVSQRQDRRRFHQHADWGRGSTTSAAARDSEDKVWYRIWYHTIFINVNFPYMISCMTLKFVSYCICFHIWFELWCYNLYHTIKDFVYDMNEITISYMIS
jgi:hypothetical protein